MAESKYYIKDAITKTAVHHKSYKALWESKWRAPCETSAYPFMSGKIEDFEPVARDIIKQDMKKPYNWDDYAQMYFPKGEELASRAAEAESKGENQLASELYLRSSAVYRIAKFPVPRSVKQKQAWEKCKETFYKGAGLRTPRIKEVLVPHQHKCSGEGDVIPISYMLPPSASASNPCALVWIIGGLDRWRTDFAGDQQSWQFKGVGTIISEIPGTGDSPAAPQDPEGPDRCWSSILDWVRKQKEIDSSRIVVWGVSTGGLYALRVAHTHHDRLLASVNQGGGCHHMFDREWLENVDNLEYPFDLAGSLAHKFGYADVESFVSEAPKFSLLNDGTLQKPCCEILMVNGMADEVFPIDDMFVALKNGLPKQARMIEGKKHMGRPESVAIILKWIYELLDLPGEVADQLKRNSY